MTQQGKILGADGETEATVNSEGRLDVVSHAHVDSTAINFTASNIALSQDFILVDISDTTNYNHLETGWLHIEYLNIEIDSDNSGDYSIQIGFLENVDGTNGDFYCVYSVSGSKTAGNSQQREFNVSPNGAKCKSEATVTSIKSLNDTSFQTDVDLASTLDPTTADTPSGSGDLVARVVRTAGTFNLNIGLSYHSHSANDVG